MPDIALCQCSENTCKNIKTCKRSIYTTKPDPSWQSYISVHPDKEGHCEYYWPTDKQRSLKEIFQVKNRTGELHVKRD